MNGARPNPGAWDPELLSVAESLRRSGYDIEPSAGDGEPIRAMIARRDLGDRAEMLAIDASGRFRAVLTWVVGEWASRDEISGVSIRVVDAVSRAVTVTGEVTTLDRVLAIVPALGQNPSWASAAGPESAEQDET